MVRTGPRGDDAVLDQEYRKEVREDVQGTRIGFPFLLSNDYMRRNKHSIGLLINGPPLRRDTLIRHLSAVGVDAVAARLLKPESSVSVTSVFTDL